MIKSILYIFFILILLAGVFIGLFFATGANQVYFPKDTTFFSVSPQTGQLVPGFQRQPLRSKFMENLTKTVVFGTNTSISNYFRRITNSAVVSKDGKWIVALHFEPDNDASEVTYALLFEVKGDNDFTLCHQFKLSNTAGKWGSSLVCLPNGAIMGLYNIDSTLRVGEFIIDEDQKTLRVDERLNTSLDDYARDLIVSKNGEYIYFCTVSSNVVTIWKYSSDGRILNRSQTYTLDVQDNLGGLESKLILLSDNHLAFFDSNWDSSPIRRAVSYMIVDADQLHVIHEWGYLVRHLLGSSPSFFDVIHIQNNIVSVSLNAQTEPFEGYVTAQFDLSTLPNDISYTSVDWYKLTLLKYSGYSLWAKISDELYMVYTTKNTAGSADNEDNYGVSYINLKPKVPRIISADSRRATEVRISSCRYEDKFYTIYLILPPLARDATTDTEGNHVGYVIETVFIKDDKVVDLHPNVGQQIVAHKSGSRNVTTKTQGVVHVPDGDLITGTMYYVGEDGKPTHYAYAKGRPNGPYPNPLPQLGVANSKTKNLKAHDEVRIIH